MEQTETEWDVMTETKALRIVAEQAHATAQLAVTALKAIALREIQLSRLDGKSKSILLVRSEKPVNEELLKQLGGLLDIEVINIGVNVSLGFIAPQDDALTAILKERAKREYEKEFDVDLKELDL
jgi:hypothetical protein